MATVRKIGLFPAESCVNSGVAPNMVQTDEYNAGTGQPIELPPILKDMTLQQTMSFLWRVRQWKFTVNFDWRWLYTIYSYNETNDNYDRVARDYITGTETRIMENIVAPENLFQSEKDLVCNFTRFSKDEMPDIADIFMQSSPIYSPIYKQNDTYSLDCRFDFNFGQFTFTPLRVGNTAGSSEDQPSGSIPFFQNVAITIKWLDHEFNGRIGIQGFPNGVSFPEGAQPLDGPNPTAGDDFSVELTPTSLEITSSNCVLEATEYWNYDT